MFEHEIECTLSEELKYHHNGDINTTKLVVLKAPSPDQNTLALKMSQYIMQILAEHQRKNVDVSKDIDADSIKDLKMTGKMAVSQLLCSNTVEINDVESVFKKLMTSGSCLIGGEESMISDIYKKLSYIDVMSLMGDYINSFFLTYLLTPSEKI